MITKNDQMPDSSQKSAVIARRVTIRGLVQGVGFRPFVFRMAQIHHVHGWVLNGRDGVEIHAEGRNSDVDVFLTSVHSQAPAAAHVTAVDVQEVVPEGFSDFQILGSRRDSVPTARISPDLSLCDECLRDLQNPPIGETTIPTSIVPNADPVIRLSKVFRTIARVRRWLPGKCVCRASTNTTTRSTADIMLSPPPVIRAGQATD